MVLISLRRLIVIPFIVLMLFAGGIMYYFSTVTVSNVADGVGLHYIKEVENRVYDRVVDFIAPLNDIVEINRKAFSFRPNQLNDLSNVAGRFYEQAVPYTYMSFISFAAERDGKYIASVRDPFGQTDHHLTSNYLTKPFSLEGFEYDPRQYFGEKITSAPPYDGYDPRKRPFYTDAVKQGDAVWSDVAPYYGYKTLGVGLSAPVYDQQGNLLGVTATSVALIELDKFLKSIELGDNSYAFLAEENGDLIATSKSGELYRTEDGVTTRVSLKTHESKAFQIASKQLVMGAHTLDVDGEHYLYHVHAIVLPHGKKWLIGVLIPQSYYYRLLTEYSNSILLITLGLFISIALIGSLIAHHIGKPIRALNNAAKDSKFESITRLPNPLSPIREIDSLSQGLRVMAHDLSDIMQNLEKKVAQRTSDLKYENEHLLEQSNLDELTGLYNRRGFNLGFDQALLDAQQQSQSIAFVICDIDHFKRVNDLFGHTVGDQALQVVADVLKSQVRQHDIVARYGGEEFALVMVGMSQEEILSRLNKVRQAFLERPVCENHHITMSFGIAYRNDSASHAPQTLITEADEKLYQAKNTGRDKIVA
ncbi:diguanylate cyclase [Marinomonas mediterranea]|uniref:sensor domain-containing diguanylate cyclase n=1 Tax=Marinomonas mediterranea TaxID=119864 RepID=UPI00234A3276|nr:diguanylate cyclase [Marinomonas mediterranea]WCN15222.1 diguanylate cyclase [Marinomonas mediterranea]